MRLANIKDFLLTPCIPVPFSSSVVWILGINENLTLVSSWRVSASMVICRKDFFRDLANLKKKTIWATSLLQRLHLVGATGQSLHVQGICWLERLLSESKFLSEGCSVQSKLTYFSVSRKVGCYLLLYWLLSIRPASFVLTLMFKIQGVPEKRTFWIIITLLQADTSEISDSSSQLLWKGADWEEWRSWVLSNLKSRRPSGPHF